LLASKNEKYPAYAQKILTMQVFGVISSPRLWGYSPS